MWQTITTTALAFHRSFHSSGVIWFARIQVLGGAVWAVLTATDLAPLIGNPKYVTAWLVFSGIVTEMSRRSRSEEDEAGHLVPRRDDDHVTVAVPSPLSPTSGTTK